MTGTKEKRFAGKVEGFFLKTDLKLSQSEWEGLPGIIVEAYFTQPMP
jgi:hypothetical protein